MVGVEVGVGIRIGVVVGFEFEVVFEVVVVVEVEVEVGVEVTKTIGVVQWWLCRFLVDNVNKEASCSPLVKQALLFIPRLICAVVCVGVILAAAPLLVLLGVDRDKKETP